ncbi:DNA-binding protein [Bradyrhizobium sp. IC3195]|uniref:DNA-binding protein n=1 Tax=Bradyrhizobium sp. IC3195 TaxID=2793804 RepID=UPI001CD1CF40|nr:DNA-binding protein [Bradyrhizobium sp. IC3195]MCA1467237.1 DNA-binding protein [Bradyrhizobium sp. IC3195]
MDKQIEDSGDIVWGAEGIAGVIKRSVVATNHLLAQGALPAKKVAGRWVASRRRLLEHLLGEAA